MLHPLKGATSFECDGCGHHASFHKMDNREDEESVRRWKEAEQVQDKMQARLMDLIGFDNMRAATQRLPRGESENRGNDSSGDDLEIVEDVTESRRPARKRQRTGGG